jgi:tetratricopeptide (TPR) repeat protein
MPEPVFISYARSVSREHAQALQAALAKTDTPAFLDTQDIQIGAQFPRVLVDAILGARVFVLFSDARYFQSWYCLREMRLALAEFEARVARGEPDDSRRVALEPVVVALPTEGLPAQELNRLPVALANENSATADAIDRLVTLIRARAGGATIGERQRAAGVSVQVQTALVTESLVPPPANLAGLRLYPLALPVSLGDGFIGRHDELWRLDLMLATGRGDPRRTAAPVVAVHGGPGTGKSRLALEYLHRFGATRFPGGIFWVDASGTRDVDEQHHGIWRQLDPARNTASLVELREQGRDVAQMLAQAIHDAPTNQPILFILDNVPEAAPGTRPLPLRTWCPAQPGEVAILATSRRRLDVGAPGIEVMSLGVLSLESAVRLLARDIGSPAIDAPVWRRVAEAVGCLPLALDLLNKAIEAGAANVDEIARDVEGASVAVALDEQAASLEEFVGEDTVRGVTEAFELSFRQLPESAQQAAILFAFLAPAPIPQAFLDVMEFETPPRTVRLRLITHAFLTGHADAPEGSVPTLGQMHRVLASFLRGRSPDPDRDRTNAVMVLSLSIGTRTSSEPSDWPLFRASLPHVREALGNLERVPAGAGPVPIEHVALIHQLGDALKNFAEIAGDRDALIESVRALRIAAAKLDRDTALEDWATLQVQLADTLRMLGQREVGTAHATEAATLYRGVLELGDRLSADLLTWARAGLAGALDELGDPTAAVVLWREVISKADRAKDPLGWAAYQNNLGNALDSIEPETDEHVRASRAAFEASLEERTREREPEGWAQTQANLARTLLRLGDMNDSAEGTGYLREALTLLHQALEVLTRDRRPYDWAMIQWQLAETLDLLGQREEDRNTRRAAVDAYFLALEEIDRDRDPRAWARLQETIGDICRQLVGAEGTPDDDDRQLLQISLDGFESALEVFTREADLAHWAQLQAIRGEVLFVMSRGQPDVAQLDQAIEALRAAIDGAKTDDDTRRQAESVLAKALELKAQRRSAGA